MKRKTQNIVAISCLFALGLSSCGDNKQEGEAEDKGLEINQVLLSERPADVISISQLRENGQPGQEVAFSGLVMGRDPVFIEGRAVMVMGDASKLTPCNLRPGDNCAKPWDVCCDDPEVIRDSVVTVQVLDGETQKPLRTSLKGLSGIKELSELSVTGTVAENSTKNNMIVNATGIYVDKQ